MRLALAALLLMWGTAAVAQTTTEPALHHRGPAAGQDAATGGGKERGASTLPTDASGEYMLDETGSVVQITIDNGVLDGYISKLTEQQTSALTYFFDHTTIHGNQLTFTTKQVHGIWYSFDGAIVRGDAQSRQENGFYRLKGTWVMHDDTAKDQSKYMLNLKSTPRGE